MKNWLLFILIPTAQEGPNKGLVHNMQMPQQAVNNEEKHLTHYLFRFSIMTKF
ncbi:hypothetical protein CCAN11_2130020 [Capnocytophaga canimorsus]|uniref:Uncharacterized protein n=1 Tax=Capnocytophaga canimorsus TaxID=28188 RepID=A0A0B7IEL8_9FLAO|nr:hypothetical protein [Capnocytophaga canimorsus]CEN50361.1 hypothetical protein CCAN11_2130020 [Capnocytophaga canimorsus]